MFCRYVPSFIPPGLAAMVNKEKDSDKRVIIGLSFTTEVILHLLSSMNSPCFHHLSVISGFREKRKKIRIVIVVSHATSIISWKN